MGPVDIRYDVHQAYSKKLKELEQTEKPIIPQQPVKSMVPTSLPPPPPGTHGTEYELLYNLVTSDGMDELYEARREIIDIILHDTARKQLTDSDIAYLQKMIDAKEKEYQEKYPVGEEKEIFRKVEPLKRPKKQIMGAREIIAKREREELVAPRRQREREKEYIREEARITERAGIARADTSYKIAQELKSKTSEILRYGLREYIQKKDIDIIINNELLAMIAEELIKDIKIREPENIREFIAKSIIDREGVWLLAYGVEAIKDSNTMIQLYNKVKSEHPDLPDFNTVVKDVTNTILRIK